jgi:hypothetical protein
MSNTNTRCVAKISPNLWCFFLEWDCSGTILPLSPTFAGENFTNLPSVDCCLCFGRTVGATAARGAPIIRNRPSVRCVEIRKGVALEGDS